MCFTGGNIKGCSHCRKHYNGSSKGEKIELLFDPAISLQGTQTKVLKEGTWTDIYILMSISNCVHNIQKGKTNLMSIKGLINKHKATYHTMDCYSPVKKMKFRYMLPW